MQQSTSTPDDTADPETTPLTDVLADLTPSAKLVVKTLEYNDDALTQSELADKSRLPARTVRYALTHDDAAV
ncbi:ArsR family transcriptional regulator [Haladaptatus pallidirubidus]|uniref:Winged helix-turn-helix DNA-binding n=1 Tax=Haladaptatus pallidirubidus TaxID=1008152 RepID=A0AAV3UPT2_9EURY